jgi:hypothetical protein
MDGHLTKRRGGKKGQIRPFVRFFCCEFSAVRVTTGFGGLDVQEASPRDAVCGNLADVRSIPGWCGAATLQNLPLRGAAFRQSPTIKTHTSPDW